MKDLQEIIKAILDKDCLDNLNGKCRKCLIYHGKADTPVQSCDCFNLCWLCHEHDNLAREIAYTIENKSVIINSQSQG